MEILPSKRLESHSESENGLKRPFGVKNDKYGPCHGADFYETARPRTEKYMSTHPPPGGMPTLRKLVARSERAMAQK